jgi:hypothetical protein
MKIKHLFLLTFLGLVISCNDPEPAEEVLNPANVERLTELLTFDGTKRNTDFPEPTSTATTPQILKGPNKASISFDNTLFIPLQVTSTEGFAGVYLQFSNGTYFDFPLTGGSGIQNIILGVGIPGGFERGVFTIHASAYTANGEQSEPYSFDVEILPHQKNCDSFGDINMSGENTVTVRTHIFDETQFRRNALEEIEAQTLYFNVESYYSFNRVDIYKNGMWVGGTGTILPYGSAPAPSDCDNPVEDGYKDKKNYAQFTLLPDDRIDIYVIGCLGVTAWDYKFDCPVPPSN